MLVEEGSELFESQAGFADQCSQSALGKLLVVGNGQATMRRLPMPKDDVTASLAVHLIADLAKGREGLGAG